MEFKHVSVMFDEAIAGLDLKTNGIYVDGTLGGGGHSGGICAGLGENGLLIGIDRDRDALAAAEKRLSQYKCRKEFVQSNFSDIKTVLEDLGVEKIDGALLDLGVSSFQLDNPERGFSYRFDAPLDMRMNRENSLSAYEIVNEYPEEEIFRVIRDYGEEKFAKNIAKHICIRRKEKPIETTFELNEIIKAAIPAKRMTMRKEMRTECSDLKNR